MKQPKVMTTALLWLGALGVVASTGLAVQTAQASSDRAWSAMRGKVDSRCRAAAAKQQAGKISVLVDPYGSQSYATALVTRVSTFQFGRMKTPQTSTERMICVMDKRSGKVELGGALPQ